MMKIHEAIIAAMRDVEPIAKGRKNKEQGFQYRGIDDMMNALQPVLAKHGIFVAPEVIARDRAEKVTKNGSVLLYSILTIKYTFYSDDGSSVAATVIGEGMDSGDKASNKAMSVALKYALMQVFCIPTEDEKDPDEHSHQIAAPQHPASQAPKKSSYQNDTPELQKEAKELGDKLGLSIDDRKAIMADNGYDFAKYVAALKAEIALNAVADAQEPAQPEIF